MNHLNINLNVADINGRQSPSGWLLMDKPPGISSSRALSCVKKLLRNDGFRGVKVGHAGTLDPFASGLLIVGIGKATRLMSYAFDKYKEYTFSIKWGSDTDTLDNTGQVVAQKARIPSADEIVAVLQNFSGEIEQIPPHFSAIKVQGKRAYDLARKNEDFSLSARMVMIHSLKMIEHKEGRSFFALRCGKGFYVRSLARDIARVLNCCGHVDSLRRESIGDFFVDDAHKISYIESARSFDSDLRILPLGKVLSGDCIFGDVLSESFVDALSKGKAISQDGFSLRGAVSDGSQFALFYRGSLVALCKFKNESALPFKVFV